MDKILVRVRLVLPFSVFIGKGLPIAVRTQFNYHLDNFNKARTEEQRVEAMSSAHQYFMELTSSCQNEEELNKLGASYQVGGGGVSEC